GLTRVRMPPASPTAWKTTAYSAQLGAITATTSPFASPRSNQPLACRRTASSNSAYVVVRPVAPSMKAALPANRPARSSVYGVNGRAGKLTDGNGLVKVIFPLLCTSSRLDHDSHRPARRPDISSVVVVPFQIRQVAAADTFPLRRRVLRPHDTHDALAPRGGDDP